MNTQIFAFNYCELWMVQSALIDRIVDDHRTSINVHLSTEGVSRFSEDRDEKFTLYKKLGGRETLEELISIADEARAETERFEEELREEYSR